MAITRRIVEAMNGEIVVKTKAGEGSSFCVTLELEEAEPVETEEKRFHHIGEQDVKGKRVLLTDDMEINREMAKSMLEYVGLEVEMAFDGADALEKVKIADVGYFDVVLMNVQMPKMNGYQAAVEIRKLPDGKGNVPILAMTANAFEDDIKNALAAGMNGHIAKPIDMNDLLKKIRQVI